MATKTKKAAAKKAAKGRKSPETIDRAARDALTLVGHALASLHGLESQTQARVDAAVTACLMLEG